MKKKMSSKQRQNYLDAIAALPDDAIDTSDIPELTNEQFDHAVRDSIYRPVKRVVTMRLDADVIQWLKQGGPGYQTKANALLRKEMIRAHLKTRETSNDGIEGRSVVGRQKRLKAS